MSDTPTRRATEADAPLQDFSTCHVGFVTVLETALGLPEMIVTAARSRSCAADMLKMFHDRLLAHHDDEERDLFPAVLRVAQPGDEADRARTMVAQLVREHHVDQVIIAMPSATGKTVRELCVEKQILPPAELAAILRDVATHRLADLLAFVDHVRTCLRSR